MVFARRYWPTFDRVLHHQALMERMMQVSAVDAYAAVRFDGGLGFLEACAKCRFCLHEDACQLWLALREDGPRQPPAFCPNAGFFLSYSNNDS